MFIICVLDLYEACKYLDCSTFCQGFRSDKFYPERSPISISVHYLSLGSVFYLADPDLLNNVFEVFEDSRNSKTQIAEMNKE